MCFSFLVCDAGSGCGWTLIDFSGPSNSSLSAHNSSSQSWASVNYTSGHFLTSHSSYYLISSWSGHFILLKSYLFFKKQPKSYLGPFWSHFWSNTSFWLCFLISVLSEKCSHVSVSFITIFMMCLYTCLSFPSTWQVHLYPPHHCLLSKNWVHFH